MRWVVVEDGRSSGKPRLSSLAEDVVVDGVAVEVRVVMVEDVVVNGMVVEVRVEMSMKNLLHSFLHHPADDTLLPRAV